jgi:hypothetical protein
MTPNEVGTYRIVLQIPADAKPSYFTGSGDSFDLYIQCRLGDSDPVGGKFAVKITKQLFFNKLQFKYIIY